MSNRVSIGAGLSANDRTSITNTFFLKNGSDTTTNGGGFYHDFSDVPVTIVNSVFAGNIAQTGAALNFTQNANASLTHLTIVRSFGAGCDEWHCQILDSAGVTLVDAACAAPINLAPAAVHRCSLTWVAAGSGGQQVNFVVTVNSSPANGQTSSVSTQSPVLIANPIPPGEQRVYLPVVVK